MIKFGIHSKEQLKPETLYSFLGRRKFVAMDLYDSCTGTPEEIARFQEFAICRVAMANGTLKKTHTARFDDFDRAALEQVQKVFSGVDGLNVHDLAVSDGRTCVPFFEALKERYGSALKFTASDYAPYFKVVRRTGERRRIVVDTNNHLVQIVYPPFVFNALKPESNLLYPFNFLWRSFIARPYAQRLRDAYKSNPEQFETEDVLLLCAACKKLIDHDPQFHFQTYDLLSGPLEKQHIVRAMNILNPDYFDETQMRAAVKNIYDSLEEDGLLITGSNVEIGSTVNGGVYQKTPQGFRELVKSGEGSNALSLFFGS